MEILNNSNLSAFERELYFLFFDLLNYLNYHEEKDANLTYFKENGTWYNMNTYIENPKHFRYDDEMFTKFQKFVKQFNIHVGFDNYFLFFKFVK
jgi:hypothetical protein